MTLKDGNASGVILGIIFALAGLYGAYHFYPVGGVPLWVSLAFVVIGILSLLFASTITVSIDKNSGNISFLRKRLLGAKSQTYNTADALRVELRKSYHIEQGARTQNNISLPREVMNHQSVIVFKDGTEMPLENMKSSGGSNVGGLVLMPGTGKELSISQQVASFLNIPLQEVGPSSAPIIV